MTVIHQQEKKACKNTTKLTKEHDVAHKVTAASEFLEHEKLDPDWSHHVKIRVLPVKKQSHNL